LEHILALLTNFQITPFRLQETGKLVIHTLRNQPVYDYTLITNLMH